MFTVFVTGPLASGKRTACLYLVEQGFVHIDLDEMAKDFLTEEQVIQQLVDLYGEDICDESGAIERARLAQKAFAEEGSSDALNNLIWPLVQGRLTDIILGRSSQFEPAIDKLVVEVAMLAEASELTDLPDYILGITASKEVRLERALARGMQLDDILNRMALQASDEERARICDHVIINDSTPALLHEKLDKWLVELKQEHLF